MDNLLWGSSQGYMAEEFDRFLSRGKVNISTELLLLCFAYNMNKFHAKIQNDRRGKSLHEITETNASSGGEIYLWNE